MSKRGHTEEQILPSAAPGRGRHEDKRSLPRARHQRSDVLRVEEEVRRAGAERVARAQAAARGELQAQAAGRGSLARSAHVAGDHPKKAVRPRHRRELGRWTQAAFVVSERRVSRLLPIQLATLRYRSRRDPQTALRMRLRELAANRVRFGYRRLTVLLRREGWAVNAKRIYRLYSKDGLAVRTSCAGRSHGAQRVPLLRGTRPH